MSRAAHRVCTVPGCPTLVTRGRCQPHEREADKNRGSRGYSSSGHLTFRAAVLTRDPICVLCHKAPATVADHYPRSRRDLLANKLNPNDPTRGRGLCAPCHNRETATHQPGGWNATP